MVIIIALAVVLVFVLLMAFICFYLCFFSIAKETEEEYPMPFGEIYVPYYDIMKKWQIEIKNYPQKDVEIKSHDGLTLRGKYYECKKGAPIELMFHGYRGNSKSDLCGGVIRCFKLGRNVLTVDQRANGRSEGRVITFGVRESLDCVDWVKYIVNNIDPDAKIILTGISMGASTVSIASSYDLPKNVIGVLADCPYSSAKAIIKKIMREMKLPPDLVYPLVKLGARIFGGFDLDSISPIEAVKRAKVPVIFIHGDADAFVPHSMSVELYNACTSRKRLVTVKGAGHGLAYAIDPDMYLKEISEFFKE